MKKRLFSLLLAVVFLCLFCLTALAGPAEDRIGETNSSSCIALDMDTGEELYAFRPDNIMAPASTAKIMSALLVLEAIDRGELSLTDEFTIEEAMLEAVPDDASRMSQPLQDGETVTIEDLLYAHLLASDCMASQVLAYAMGFTPEEFAAQMTSRAEELGCEHTTFTNPSGYPDEAMLTSARALALIALECMKNETFRTIVGTVSYTIPATNLSDERELTNTNRLLSETIPGKADEETGEAGQLSNDNYYPYAIGIKTGSSTPSGQCLISAMEKDGRRILIVLLGARMQEFDDGTVSWPQYTETIRVADTLFELFEEKDAVQEELDTRTAAVLAASDRYAAELSAVHDRDAGLQTEIQDASAFLEQAKVRLPYAAAALAVLLLLLIPSGLFGRKNSRGSDTKS